MISFVSAGVRGGWSRSLRTPWTRMRGGMYVVTCRSLASASTQAFSSSNIGLAISFSLVSRVPLDLVPNGLAQDLFDRRDAVLDLDEAAPSQGQHALLDGLPLDVPGLGPGQDHGPDVVVDL